MSILGDSASCGAGSNPMAQMNKYMSADRSVQREHQVSQPGSQSGGLRGAEFRQLSQRDRQLYESMQQGDRNDAFRFDEFRRDVPVPGAFEATGRPSQAGPKFMGGANWASEFSGSQYQHQHQHQHQHQPAGVSANNNWAAEFSGSSHMPGGTTGPSQVSMAPMRPMMSTGFSSGLGTGMGLGMNNGFMVNSNQYAQMQQPSGQQMQPQRSDSKWEEEFQRVEKSATPPGMASEANVEGCVDQTDDATASATAEEQQQAQHNEEEMIFDNTNYQEGATDIFDSTYPPNWDKLWDEINQDSSAPEVNRDRFIGNSVFYEFTKENEFADEEDPFALGVYMMDNGAKLSSAVLCFEEAVRRDQGHIEAWARLGSAQAQNEVEGKAILALERATLLNPRHDQALLNLAISYVNEGYDAAALQILEKWIVAKYPDISELIPGTENPTRDQLKERVMAMFLKAAQRTPTHGMDPEVQVGLGVLCYRNGDFDKAIDCFRSALSVRPNDAALWNRLGATLANASRPEEAIDAYTKALELRPSFVRARYNLAVSCVNIGCYKEAADHLFSAIALHETEEGAPIDFERSSNLLDTLRRVFFAMDRRDLIEKLKEGVTLSSFRGEFNF